MCFGLSCLYFVYIEVRSARVKFPTGCTRVLWWQVKQQIYGCESVDDDGVVFSVQSGIQVGRECYVWVKYCWLVDSCFGWLRIWVIWMDMCNCRHGQRKLNFIEWVIYRGLIWWTDWALNDGRGSGRCYKTSLRLCWGRYAINAETFVWAKQEV